MTKTRPPYTAEFRRQMVELVRAGRSPEELAQEFEPTAQSIRNWVGQAECDAGRNGAGLTTAEREELNQLRRENRQPETGTLAWAFHPGVPTCCPRCAGGSFRAVCLFITPLSQA